MLELAVLGLLKERSMHGYQLKKSLSDTLGPFWQVSYGALYPALKRLRAHGAVEQVYPKTEVGRRRNVYRITKEGERQFAELLTTGGERETVDDNGFRVRLAFFRYLKPETRIGVLERRKATLSTRLTELKDRLTAYSKPTDGYTLSLMQHGMDSTERDITWLDGMIEAERRATRSPRRARKTTTGKKEGAA
ncbi:MAG: helix-turn-helix transcriptional regulator [Actinomycetota bacterium]